MLNLYETYYKLSADPFRLSPDHKFAYGHTGYANAKAYLEYAFFQGEGFVMVTGEPGTGKTTLINEILSGLEQSHLQVATLTTTQLDTRDLLHMVAVLLGMQVTEVSKPALLMALKKYLTGQADRGWRSILVVDEAQGLSTGGLEELRLLANLQHRERLLIQICLIGQDQLRDLVQKPEMEHLRQRIIAASHLTPLTLEETVDYVEHRLCHAGWKGDPGISAGALRQIHKHSGGIPRLINLICNRLFLYGGLESRHEFRSADASHVIGELIQEQLLQSTLSMDDDGADAAAYSDADTTDLSLPRPGSISAGLQSLEQSMQQDPQLSDSSGNLAPPEADAISETAVEPAPDPRPRTKATARSRAVHAEPREPYISATGIDDPVPEKSSASHSPIQQATAKLSSTRHIAGVMVLLAGLVLLLLFGSEAGSPLAGLVKQQWSKLVASGEDVRTAIESGQRLSPEGVNVSGNAPVEDNGEVEEALPQKVTPVGDREPLPPARDTPPETGTPPATGLLEVDAVDAGESPPVLAVVPVPVTVPQNPADGWQSAIADEKRRLDAKARQTFEHQFVQRFPERPVPLVEDPVEAVSPAANASREAAVAELSSLEPKPVVEQPREIFRSLKDIHVALLEGRWSAQGKPAIFLPSEITFCGQGETHAQISCWSVPQYVAAGQRTSLQKVEATLQGFSSSGDFELVYRNMQAPVDKGDERLFWQTTEHRLWCEFSGTDTVTCSDETSGDAIELMRSPLSNNNSVGIGSQGGIPG